MQQETQEIKGKPWKSRKSNQNIQNYKTKRAFYYKRKKVAQILLTYPFNQILHFTNTFYLKIMHCNIDAYLIAVPFLSMFQCSPITTKARKK